MTIKQLKDKEKKVYLTGKVIEKKTSVIPRINIKAANIILEDDTGKCDVSIYGGKVNEVQEGDTIMICNALCKGEYMGMKKVTLGKYGYIIKKVE